MKLLHNWNLFGLLVSITHLANGQVAFDFQGTSCKSQDITLGCTISSFLTDATWKRGDGSVLRVTCSSTGPCSSFNQTIDGTTYSFRGNTSGIYMWTTLPLSEHGVYWTCIYNSTDYIYQFELGCSEVTTEGSTEGKSDATGDGIISWLLSVIESVLVCVQAIISVIVDILAECVQFTYYVVQQWYFTCRYVFKGKVVYGLQLVIVAAVTQLITMIPVVLAFTMYADNLAYYARVLIPILFIVGPFIAVGIYLLYKGCFGQKEWLHTKLHTERACVMLSHEYGKKLNTVTKDKIYFKVKASNDLFITLLDNQQKRIVDIVLGGYSHQSTHGANQNDRVVYFKDVLVSTECRIFVLECECNYITVTALSQDEKPLLKWKPTNDDQGLEICDIVISNFMQDGSYIRNERSTGSVQLEMGMVPEIRTEIRTPGEQSGNQGECTFLFRQGDCLLDNADDSCGLSCGIFLVILFPIPWILYLLLRKLTDTNWIGLKLSSVLCCQNSVEPKAKEDILLNVPTVLTNVSPKGGKNTLPAIEMTTTNENKSKKKKKKSKKQDESTRKTFSQDDTDNNEINTEADQ